MERAPFGQAEPGPDCAALNCQGVKAGARAKHPDRRLQIYAHTGLDQGERGRKDFPVRTRPEACADSGPPEQRACPLEQGAGLRLE